jgi:antitoxin VapB
MGAPQLNIKDAETTRMVRELAELTGETQTQVVRKSVEQRLQREKSERTDREANRMAEKHLEFEKVWAEIQKIQENVRQNRRGENCLSEDDLYDELGLPK